MNREQTELMLEALDRLDDEDNMNRYKLAIRKGSPAYSPSTVEEYKEMVALLEKRIALCNQIKEELKK